VTERASPASERLRVTVLGSSNSIPRPGRACSGYLIEGAGQAIVSDLGSGALANLLRLRPAESLTAVLISHMHADHFIDLIPMRYALKYGPRTHDRPVPLWLPPGGATLLRRMTNAFVSESPHDFMGEVFDVSEYAPDAGLAFGDLRLRFAPTAHFIPTYALRCELDGASVTYSADTAPAPELDELARDTGLFLCEATLLPNEREPGARGHLTAAEAAAIAGRAGVRRLALTHYPAETNAAELLTESGATFAGETLVVDDNDVLEVGPV
jgi:ribonuclease BN (tRNA processing enzyme)